MIPVASGNAKGRVLSDYPKDVRQRIFADAVAVLSPTAFRYGSVSEVIDEYHPSEAILKAVRKGRFEGVSIPKNTPVSVLAVIALSYDDSHWRELPLDVDSYRSMTAQVSVPKGVVSANRRSRPRPSPAEGMGVTAEYLDSCGYELVDYGMIGQDPGAGDVVSIAVAAGRDDFAVIRIEDWSLVKGARPARRYEVLGTYDVLDDAMEVALSEVRRLMSNYTWYQPGSMDIVPGSRRGR